jgi:hypothetical protein
MADVPPLRSRSIRHDAGFAEIGDRCWMARFEFLDVNVGLVAGERGLLVVDTHASEVEARRVVEDVRRLGVGEVIAVVNTHEHFDHAFGNVVFSEAYDAPPIYAHEAAAEGLATSGPALQERAANDPDDPRHTDIAATRLVPPTETFSSVVAVDLGARMVELVHPGRGFASATPTCCSPATSSRSPPFAVASRGSGTTASRWSGPPRSTWFSACWVRTRSWSRDTDCPSTGSSSRSNAARWAWSRRPSATSPRAASRRTRRSTRPSGPIPPRSW